MNQDKQQHLPFHEWLAVVAILGLLIVFIGVSYFSRESTLPTKGSPYHLIPPTIEVTVRGAVERSETFVLPRSARMKDVLELALPTENADLRRLKPETKLRDGRVIVIKEYPMINVCLYGEVLRPGIFRLRKGTRLKDLAELDLFTDHADLSSLQKQRRLKQGDNIKIPSR